MLLLLCTTNAFVRQCRFDRYPRQLCELLRSVGSAAAAAAAAAACSMLADGIVTVSMLKVSAVFADQKSNHARSITRMCKLRHHCSRLVDSTKPLLQQMYLHSWHTLSTFALLLPSVSRFCSTVRDDQPTLHSYTLCFHIYVC